MQSVTQLSAKLTQLVASQVFAVFVSAFAFIELALGWLILALVTTFVSPPNAIFRLAGWPYIAVFMLTAFLKSV